MSTSPLLKELPQKLSAKLPWYEELVLKATRKTYSGDGWSIELPRSYFVPPLAPKQRAEAVWVTPKQSNVEPWLFLLRFGEHTLNDPNRLNQELFDFSGRETSIQKFASTPCPKQGHFSAEAAVPERLHWLQIASGDKEPPTDIHALTYRDQVYPKAYVLFVSQPCSELGSYLAQEVLLSAARNLRIGLGETHKWNGFWTKPPCNP